MPHGLLNLYKVVKKHALAEFRDAPPWPPVTFRQSGKTYYYPFRLWLRLERELNEPVVRSEFAYVAENLLLRAGYRKTHFQADQTTLQLVSQMGQIRRGEGVHLGITDPATFIPRFSRRKTEWSKPTVCPFNELILQAAIRHKIAEMAELARVLTLLGLESIGAENLEVLSEKAVSEGHVDVLIKDCVPIGVANKIVLEAKLGKAKKDDLLQVKAYTDEFGPECISRVLIAEDFSKGMAAQAMNLGIRLFRYNLDLEWDGPKTFEEIVMALRLAPES